MPAFRDLSQVATREEFGRELTRLKDEGDLAIREVAKRIRASGGAAVSSASLGDYFAGKRLPTDSTLAKVLAAFGVTDPDELTAWQEARQRARTAPAGSDQGAVELAHDGDGTAYRGDLAHDLDEPQHDDDPAPGVQDAAGSAAEQAPYRGLACYRHQDAAYFCGRAEVTALVFARATESRAIGLPLMVVGPSGSGKSSLLRAGLIPMLAEPDRDVPVLIPGANPLAELTRQLADRPEVVVVDQFEEIFAAAVTQDSRAEFIRTLFAVASGSHGHRACVVIGLRADFYAQALQHPLLAKALQESQVVVGSMNADELRQAIVEPARLARTSVDDALVDLLLDELRPRGTTLPHAEPPRTEPSHTLAQGAEATAAAHHAGALPLLSYALLCAWDRHRSGRLTISDYLAGGGIGGAVRNAADQALAELSQPAKVAARHMFGKLVRIAEDAPDTLCRVPVAELLDGTEAEQGAAREALETFAARRLLTVDDGTVEITHMALLATWPRLRGRLDASRADRLIRRRVTVSAQQWQDGRRDVGDLLRGGKLAMARSLASDPAKRAELTSQELDLLEASLAADNARRQAERKTAQRQAERRSTRRLRGLVASLAVVLTVTVVVAAVLTADAFGQRSRATTQRDQAISRQIAAVAARLRGQDLGLAAQLSVAAYRQAATPQALGALLDSSATATPSRLTGLAGIVQAVAVSPDRRLLAAADSTGELSLWNLPASGAPAQSQRLAFRFGSAAEQRRVQPGWPDSRRRQRLRRRAAVQRGRPGTSRADRGVHRAPRCGLLDGIRVRRRNPRRGERRRRRMAVEPRGPRNRPCAERGRRLSAVRRVQPRWDRAHRGDLAGTIRLWNMTKPAKPKPIGRPLGGPGGTVDSVAVSPDGSTLAAAGHDSRIFLWNLRKRTFLGAGFRAPPAR